MRSEAGFARAAGLLLAGVLGAVALGAGGCRDAQSFIVLTVQSSTAAPITGVGDLVVTVTNGGSSRTLTYPALDGAPFTITGAADPVTHKIGKTLAVSFDPNRGDEVGLAVVARDATNCTIATGQTTTLIRRNGVSTATVMLAAVTCNQGADAAAGPEGGITFSGCEPAASTCGPNMTCAVDCAAQQGTCVPAGTGAQGSACGFNTDCAPGTQCFLYGSCGADGGSVGACLKFCTSDNDCGGGGSLCRGTVSCPVGATSVMTAYRTCTFGCDPRGAATQGCPAGLRCFVVDTMDQVDCACTDATHTQQEGDACDHATGHDCAPGLICNMMAGTLRCRKVCRRDQNSADCGAGQTCELLTNDQTYGACL